MKRWLRVAGIVALASLAAELAVAAPFGRLIGEFVRWMRAAGPIGPLVYAAAYLAATVLLVPGTVLTAGAGLAYGPWLGTLLVSPVSVAAASVSFLLGRTVARGWVARRLARDARFRAIDRVIGQHGFRIVVLLRLSPLLPFNLLNYALGISGVSLRDYVLGSFIGMLPATFLYVYIGSIVSDLAGLSRGAGAGVPATRYVYWAGLAATAAATVYITRLARRALRDELARQGPERPPTVPGP